MQVTNTGSSVIAFKVAGTLYTMAASAVITIADKYMSVMEAHAAAMPDLSISLAVSDEEVIANNAAYAAAGHNHSGVYSPVAHNHDTAYAPKLTHGAWADRPTEDLFNGQQYYADDEGVLYTYMVSGVGTKWFAPAYVEHV